MVLLLLLLKWRDGTVKIVVALAVVVVVVASNMRWLGKSTKGVFNAVCELF